MSKTYFVADVAECAVKTLLGCNVCNYVKDEGRPLVIGLQELVTNQCMLLC